MGLTDGTFGWWADNGDRGDYEGLGTWVGEDYFKNYLRVCKPSCDKETFNWGCGGLVKCRLGLPQFHWQPGPSGNEMSGNIFHANNVKKYKVRCFKSYADAAKYANSIGSNTTIVGAQFDNFLGNVKPRPGLPNGEIDPLTVPTDGSGNYSTLRQIRNGSWCWEFMNRGGGNVYHLAFNAQGTVLGLPDRPAVGPTWKQAVFCVFVHDDGPHDRPQR